MKPATPGFLTTLTATILLVVVSFNVPYFKSIFFLQATYNEGNNSGVITLGTLGYCLTVNGNVTCTKPSIGYQFNPNVLLGDTTFIQIPEIISKWLTYALFLHVIALGLSGTSAIFGLLAHIREFSMTCFSSCISGAAASITLIAFIFDLVLFFAARARIRSIKGSSATIGNAIWLTLAAWILLFISGCMYGIGRCCLSSRPRGPRSGKGEGGNYGGGIPAAPTPAVNNSYAEQMRMDAIKAEVERKARQATSPGHSKGETGLPAFEEYETAPLTANDDNISPYRDQPTPSNNRFGAAGAATGYVPASSLPSPHRQPSVESVNNGGRGPSGFVGQGYGYNSPTRQGSGYAQGYPPQTSYGNQQGYGQRQRPPSLSERNIYENAGISTSPVPVGGIVTPSALAARNNSLLQPDAASHGRADSYGAHSQASSYHSAYSHNPYGSYTHGQDQSAYNYQNPSTPSQQQYEQNQVYPSTSFYPPASNDPYAQYQSDDTYNKPLPNPTPSPYPQQQSPTGFISPSRQPSDLNFPGVPARQNQYPAPVAIDADAWRHPAASGRTPTSPTRLHGWREESEPSSTLGASIGAAVAGNSRIPDESPPVYEPSDRSEPSYRNEKVTFRNQ